MKARSESLPHDRRECFGYLNTRPADYEHTELLPKGAESRKNVRFFSGCRPKIPKAEPGPNLMDLGRGCHWAEGYSGHGAVLTELRTGTELVGERQLRAG